MTFLPCIETSISPVYTFNIKFKIFFYLFLRRNKVFHLIIIFVVVVVVVVVKMIYLKKTNTNINGHVLYICQKTMTK